VPQFYPTHRPRYTIRSRQEAAMTIAVEAADTTLPALMERIEHGDEVRLLKHGRTVARIVPDTAASPAFTPEQRVQAQQALRDMDALSRELNLGPFNFDEFKADRDTGRR
jgi:antitoxin (DNA-binding transcriptional repressor) of toxin-antitoxin stability system